MTQRADAVDIQLNYSLDTSGFFDPGNEIRRERLEQAALTFNPLPIN